jgi:hypothetical protein
MKLLRLGAIKFLILSLLSTGAVVNARDLEYGSPVLSTIRQMFFAPTQNEFRASENGREQQAPNRSRNLQSYFDASGIWIHDRMEPANCRFDDLSLVGIGQNARLEPDIVGWVPHLLVRVLAYSKAIIIG